MSTEHLHKIKPDQPTQAFDDEQDRKTVIGYKDFLKNADPKSEDCLAKVVYNDNSPLYYIRMTSGGKFVDFRSKPRREQTKFKKVSPKTFELYKLYLTSGTDNFRIQAEREFINA